MEWMTEVQSASVRVCTEVGVLTWKYPWRKFWLAYKPADAHRWGELAIVHGDTEHEGWILVGVIPTTREERQWRAWIREQVGKLPIIPTGE